MELGQVVWEAALQIVALLKLATQNFFADLFDCFFNITGRSVIAKANQPGDSGKNQDLKIPIQAL